MGFTIEDALVQTQDIYHLELLAGKNGCSNAISWVHMIEDTTIIKQLWGKELAVTTGMGFQTHDTGKYIFEVPQDIIDYCNEQDFPLLVMPWEVSMADLIKDLSMRCLHSEREDQQISIMFQKLFVEPHLVEEIRQSLMGSFDVDGLFQVVLIAIENSDQFDAIERRRISFQLQLCLEKIDSPYTFFWFDSHFVLIVNNLEETILEKVIDKMYKRSKKRMLTNSLYVGIGSQMSDLSQLILSYKRALAAVNMAMKFDYPIINFEEMGVYQILFSIEDKQILISMYYRLLQPLINYDQKHHSELEKTLYYYLVYDGSMQAMAKNLYMHRNTINYRMNKIKELLNCEFESIDEKMEYLLAFYIKKIMNAKKNRSS